MAISEDLIVDATDFLLEGGEGEAADLLKTCSLVDWDVVDYWMDGNRQLDGLLIELGCPRTTYEVLLDSENPVRKAVEEAIRAVLPSDTYLKSIRARAIPLRIPTAMVSECALSATELKELVQKIENQKALMTAVSTGGPRIKEVNQEYIGKRAEIADCLRKLEINDPNPYPDLWTWYGKWSDGSLPSYQSRRTYLTSLFQPLLDGLRNGMQARPVDIPAPTGWARVDRNVEKIVVGLESAENEEDFQSVGLLCREAMISLAQAVYNPKVHGSPDGVTPSATDAKRMLEAFIAAELAGSTHSAQRKFTKALYDLAVALQHRRTAAFRDAALCAEATRSLINTIAIIAGQRDPRTQAHPANGARPT